MRRIELIGTSGVGKTTLYRKICKIPPNKRSYFTLNEAYKFAAISNNTSFTNIKPYVYRLLLKLGVFNSKELGLSRRALDLKNNKNKWIVHSDYLRFQISFMCLYHYLSSETNPYTVKVRIENYIRTIDEFLILEHFLPDNKEIILDEGLIHHGHLSYDILSKFSQKEIKKDVLLNPAGIIICEQTPEIIFNQALERKKSGTITFTHGPLSDRELYHHIIKEVESNGRKAEYFKKIGVPVLHINTGKDDCINLKLINEFINEKI